MSRFRPPRRAEDDRTPDEEMAAEANELHDTAVRLLLDALTGPQAEADTP